MVAFLSSTCYDLADLRAEVEKFLLEKGYSLLLSNRSNFPVAPGTHRHDICIDNVSKCDLFVLVVDKRFGAPYYKISDISITWAEFREAIKCKKRIVAFVRQDIFNERLTYGKNKSVEFKPAFTDNIKTFHLIDEIQNYPEGVWMQPFSTSVEVKEMLGNLYDTNYSPLNENSLKQSVSGEELPQQFNPNVLSPSAVNFLNTYFKVEAGTIITKDILEKGIAAIPESPSEWGKLLSFESIPTSNDLFYFYPLRNQGDEGEMIWGIAPTALGKSVREEFQQLFNRTKHENRAFLVFVDTVKRKPLICKTCEFIDRSYIVGIYSKDEQYIGTRHFLCILTKFANTWQVTYNESIDGEFATYSELGSSFEFISVGNNLYFYFERLVQQIGTIYQGMGEVEFCLFDFGTRKLVKLLYDGTHRSHAIEGKFDFTLIDQHHDAGTYRYILEEKASKSKWIYRTPENYDLDAPDNCIERWKIDNPDFYESESGSIYFYLYNENIFWGIEFYGDLTVFKANTSHAENSSYLITYYFAGPILALRKSDNKYFVVLVPEGYGAGGTWGLRSINAVKFLDEHTVHATSTYEFYKIDLKNMNYQRGKID
jgi:hypothetical protein